MLELIYQYVIPNLFFFAVAFAVFTILQAFIVLIILWLRVKYQKRLMVFMLSCYKNYRKINFYFVIGIISILIGISVIFAEYIRSFILRTESTIFAGIMLIFMILIYFALANLKGALSIRNKADKMIYLILSAVLFFAVLIFINLQLPNYRIYVYKNMVGPVVSAIAKNADANQQQALLDKFRLMAKEGQCVSKDYKKEKNPNIIHNFLFVAKDENLKTAKGPMIPGNNDLKIRGRICTDTENIFLLTDYGEWYWVIDSAR